MNKNTINAILIIFCVCTSVVNAQDYLPTIDTFINEQVQNKKLLSQDAHWIVTSEHISSISNIHHIYFSQEFNGIEIANTESSLHFSSENKIIANNINFISEVSNKIKTGNTPTFSAIEIVNAISQQMDYTIDFPINILEESKGVNQKTKLTDGGIAKRSISLKLIYFQNNNNDIVLAWLVNLLENDYNHSWDFYVDANTGKILKKINNHFNCIGEDTVIPPTKLNYNRNLFDIPNYKKPSKINILECENCYEVIPYPYESPYYSNREIVINPIEVFSSPFGWHDINGTYDPDYTITYGNNIRANTASNNYSPDGGDLLSFTDYPFSEDYSEPNIYADASLTNVFYWANLMHDVLYKYGFNEVAGNFQSNNYNKGGEEGDSMIVLGQDDSFPCNAAIFPGADGLFAVIIMGTCDDKDSNFDNLVVCHEYAHGLTFRLVGGAMSTYCLTGRDVLEEGYSDWYGLMLTMKDGDIDSTPRGYATYLFNQGPSGNGIRPYPYTTDMSINPLVYEYIPDFSSRSNWVWASALWELTWNLIEEYGFDENIYNFTGDINQDAGNIIAMAIVTESLKLLPCDPTIIEARDAIFEANEIIYGVKNDCLLWNAFAKRGLGTFAHSGPYSVASYETPSLLASFESPISNICEMIGLVQDLTGGLPFGGVYSGPGVIDDGNGYSFSIDSSLLEIGTYTLIYEVPDSLCSEASYAEIEITVEKDEEPPFLNCLQNSDIIIPDNTSHYTIIDYSTIMGASDNCGEPSFVQTPEPGTTVGTGIVEIFVESEDSSGNMSSCSFNLNIRKEINENNIENIFTISPNPTDSEILLTSNFELNGVEINIFSLDGKLIKTYNIPNFNFEYTLSIDEFATGLYFIQLHTKEYTLIKRVLKI